MHTIKLKTAPQNILSVINVNSKITNQVQSLNEIQVNRLKRLELYQNNIINCDFNIITFYEEQNARLKLKKNSFTNIGPKIYNFFTSMANFEANHMPKPIKHQNLPLNGYKNRLKNFVLELQVAGDETNWELDNQPLYTFSRKNMVLRNNKNIHL